MRMNNSVAPRVLNRQLLARAFRADGARQAEVQTRFAGAQDHRRRKGDARRHQEVELNRRVGEIALPVDQLQRRLRPEGATEHILGGEEG